MFTNPDGIYDARRQAEGALAQAASAFVDAGNYKDASEAESELAKFFAGDDSHKSEDIATALATEYAQKAQEEQG